MLKMIEVLKKPQPKAFDYNQNFWMREEKNDKSKKNCGCIVATLLHYPYFKKLGLKYYEGYSDWKDYETNKGEHRELGIVYKKEHGIGALTKLFELSTKEAIYIFGALFEKKGRTIKAALKRIQEVYDGKLKFSKPTDASTLLNS